MQKNVRFVHFRLPQGNLYTKGVNDKSLVGSFGEQQLLEHTHNYHITNLSNTGYMIRGGLDNHRGFSGHLWHSSVATSIVGKQTNEGHRIHLLEGYYVGE